MTFTETVRNWSQTLINSVENIKDFLSTNIPALEAIGIDANVGEIFFLSGFTIIIGYFIVSKIIDVLP